LDEENFVAYYFFVYLKIMCRFENTTRFSIQSGKSKVEFDWSEQSRPSICFPRYISTVLSHAVRKHLGGQGIDPKWI